MLFQLLKRSALVLFILGVSSATATADDPPLLFDLDYFSPEQGIFVIYGTIDDEAPQGCIIGFEGVLLGHTVTPNSDGSFAFVVFLDPEDMGYTDGQALDAANQESNIDSMWLSY